MPRPSWAIRPTSQQAQPSTFGHYLLAFVPPALRDGERFSAALEQVNTSPGGAGCVNGSRLLDDRGAIADALGFDGVIAHTRDAMWQTDVFIDLLATSASMIANQAKLAEDLEIWSSQEFDYVDLAGPFTRASVLMPQKRNPYATVDHPGSQWGADRPDERLPGRGQEPVGPQRQPDLRLRRDPQGPRLHHPGERPHHRSGENPERQRRAHVV